MIIDKRTKWEYKSCKIVPIACYRDSTWGKEAEPIDFGFGPRSRYWRIDFPDGTWIHVATKAECRRYINDRATPANMTSTVTTKLGTFVVHRRIGPGNVKMCKGLDDPYEEELAFSARVINPDGKSLGSVSNSTTLCLPGGSVRAPRATDRQIVAAVAGDEHIYDSEADGAIAAAILETDRR